MEEDAYIVCQSTDITNLVNTVNRMVNLGYFPMGCMSVEPWRNGDEPAKYYQAMYKPAQDFRGI